MKISELIIELQNLQIENWDLSVEVQYRDGGWDYHWTDENVTPFVRTWYWRTAVIL